MISKSTIKYIQTLKQKKFRDQNLVFIAEGPKLMSEIIAENLFDCVNIYALKEWIDTLDESFLKKIDDKLVVINNIELEKISSLVQPNSVLGIFKQKTQKHLSDPVGKISIVLDEIKDPGNIGTIIRSADWFGIKNIICSNNCADVYNTKVVQSTMASLGRVNIHYTDIVKYLQNTDVKKYATTLNGTSVNLVKKMREGLIIIGNESNGISENVMILADEKITINKIGNAESLNAAIAASIILYAITSE